MSEERKQVLTMLAEGKISAEEAERLLQKLGGGDANQGRGERRRKPLNIGAEALPEEIDTAGGAPKFLRVEVHSDDGDQVSVRVPLRLIRTGVKLTTMLPTETNAKLSDNGIDLNELGKLESEELVDALCELKVNVDAANGDTVRVFCE